MASKKMKRRKKKIRKKAFRNDGKLTINAKIFEGESTIMKVKKIPLKKGIDDINFFAEKKLNIKKRRKKRKATRKKPRKRIVKKKRRTKKRK